MDFLTYKEKPLVRSGNEIYYGDMAEPYVIKFTILSAKKEDGKEVPDKVSVQLLKSDIQLPERSVTFKKQPRIQCLMLWILALFGWKEP
jgi:hypothetical protein